jgi:glutamyl/glutaminyl-tRNA synthetase
LGDFDAKKLESGFSTFDSNDLQNLNVGEAIGRVGKNTDDFSLRTFPPKQVEENENRRIIIENTREKYSKRIFEIEEELNIFLSDKVEQGPVIREEIPKQKEEVQVVKSNIEGKGKEYLENFKEKEEVREHRYLQTFIKKIAEQRGFKASIEETVENGRIDVALVKDSIKIACEIAVFNSVEYELKNIRKCLNSKYSLVCVVSNDEKHLDDIKGKVVSEIEDKEGIFFFTPKQMSAFLDSLMPPQGKEMKRIRGYRVKVNYRIYNPNENDE